MYTVHARDPYASKNITIYNWTQLLLIWCTAPILYHITWIFLNKWTCQLCDQMIAYVYVRFIWFPFSHVLVFLVRQKQVCIVIVLLTYYQVIRTNYRLDTNIFLSQASWFPNMMHGSKIWLGNIFQNQIEQQEKPPSIYLDS